MTIKEFYKWAKENKVEDFEVEIQYANGEGFDDGSRDLEIPFDINPNKKNNYNLKIET